LQFYTTGHAVFSVYTTVVGSRDLAHLQFAGSPVIELSTALAVAQIMRLAAMACLLLNPMMHGVTAVKRTRSKA